MKGGDNFLPIPSLNNKFEINGRGVVRNVKTKHIIQHYVRVRPNGKTLSRSINQLLWEVHGIRRKCFFHPNIPTSCQKNGEKYYFESLIDCAKFLSGKVYYAQSTILYRLKRHKSEIGGWEILYHDEPR